LFIAASLNKARDFLFRSIANNFFRTLLDRIVEQVLDSNLFNIEHIRVKLIVPNPNCDWPVGQGLGKS
jgi:hypothetical protein